MHAQHLAFVGSQHVLQRSGVLDDAQVGRWIAGTLFPTECRKIVQAGEEPLGQLLDSALPVASLLGIHIQNAHRLIEGLQPVDDRRTGTGHGTNEGSGNALRRQKRAREPVTTESGRKTVRDWQSRDSVRAHRAAGRFVPARFHARTNWHVGPRLTRADWRARVPPAFSAQRNRRAVPTVGVLARRGANRVPQQRMH